MQPKIIIPIRPTSFSCGERKLQLATQHADVIEIWLDRIAGMRPETIKKLFALTDKPLLLNCKDSAEKGIFRGGPVERAEVLRKFAEVGGKQVQFVDLPLDFPAELVTDFKKEFPKVELILSWHDFEKMPSLKELKSLAKKAEKQGADVIKIVGTARELAENLPILQLARELVAEKKKFLAMAMGEAGQLSRVLVPQLGGWGMFAAASSRSASAPGQLLAADLRQIWQNFE